MSILSRRDLLKLAGLAPASIALSKIAKYIDVDTNKPNLNIVILVLDALTAKNMSLYGYNRQTTPHIERFAERATVYHSHYSPGTFTSTGTASLLTGMYPWTHRATNYSGLVRREFIKRNLFHLIAAQYTRVGFSQNILADLLLTQFDDDLDLHMSPGTYSEMENVFSDVNGSDALAKYRAYDYYLFSLWSQPGSLLFGAINKYWIEYRSSAMVERTRKNELQYYEKDLFFKIENVFDGLVSCLHKLQSPFLAYFHIFPPHEPYVPSPGFLELFKDGWEPPWRPKHPLLEKKESQKELDKMRIAYDRYLAHTDSALGNFLDAMKSTGVLDNTYLVLTSDHGQMFERGALGHQSPLLYDSAIRVPLLISSPGQLARRDVHSVTNSIDILPTLLKISGSKVPDWCEGRILPGFGGKEDDLQNSFSMDAKHSSPNGYLSTISVSMRKGKYKLIYYKGYSDYKGYPDDKRFYDGLFELYNLESDPEELRDIIKLEPVIAHQMKDLLLSAYNAANLSLT
jgi:arylsulfatase A-like enzyme